MVIIQKEKILKVVAVILGLIYLSCLFPTKKPNPFLKKDGEFYIYQGKYQKESLRMNDKDIGYLDNEDSVFNLEEDCLKDLSSCYDNEGLQRIELAYKANNESFYKFFPSDRSGKYIIPESDFQIKRYFSISEYLRPFKRWYDAKNKIAYGCYCGCGNKPEKYPTCNNDAECCKKADPESKTCPCDRLDCLCKEHDLCYAEARKIKNEKQKYNKESSCDKVFYEDIEKKVLNASDKDIDDKHKETTQSSKAPYALFRMKYLANLHSPLPLKYRISFLGKDADSGCKN